METSNNCVICWECITPDESHQKWNCSHRFHKKCITSWNKGLKTGIYYLRRRGRHQAQQFTIEPDKQSGNEDEDEICEACGS